MPHYKLTYKLTVIKSVTIEAESAFGAWNKFKKRWRAKGEQDVRIHPDEAELQFIDHEEER